MEHSTKINSVFLPGDGDTSWCNSSGLRKPVKDQNQHLSELPPEFISLIQSQLI